MMMMMVVVVVEVEADRCVCNSFVRYVELELESRQ